MLARTGHANAMTEITPGSTEITFWKLFQILLQEHISITSHVDST